MPCIHLSLIAYKYLSTLDSPGLHESLTQHAANARTQCSITPKKNRIAQMLQILHVSPYNDRCRRHCVSSLLVPECNFYVEFKMASTNVGLACGKN